MKVLLAVASHVSLLRVLESQGVASPFLSCSIAGKEKTKFTSAGSCGVTAGEMRCQPVTC